MIAQNGNWGIVSIKLNMTLHNSKERGSGGGSLSNGQTIINRYKGRRWK